MNDHILNRVYRSILWFEENKPDEKQSFTEMAEISCLSPYHFSRIFHSITGISPALYCRRRFLTNAATLLINSNRSILDIALESHYESQEAFTRAFKNMFNINPGKLRKSPINLQPLYQQPLTYDDLVHFNKGGVNLKPEFHQHPATIVQGTSGIIDYNGVWQANDIWNRYIEIQGTQKTKSFQTLYGICRGTYVNKTIAPQLLYLAGHSSPTITSNKFDTATINEGTYAVFKHSGSIENFETTLRYIWQNWLPRSGIELLESPDFETYGSDFNHETTSGTINIWLPIKE